ncbi:TPA: hypothetical protein ACJ86E_001499 [Streptococcus pneumoniae]
MSLLKKDKFSIRKIKGIVGSVKVDLMNPKSHMLWIMKKTHYQTQAVLNLL